MSVLPKLASVQGRRDEAPNKELGRELVDQVDLAGIQEIAQNLHNPDRKIRIDCLAVMEQIGLLDPGLIEDYAFDFLTLVFSSDNRQVWAAMIDLALIADRKPDVIFEHYDELVRVIEQGSVITRDNGIKTLARVASTKDQYQGVIMPYLLDQLRSCRPKSVGQYAESIRCAVDKDSQEDYLDILENRLPELSAAQQKRVKKAIRSLVK